MNARKLAAAAGQSKYTTSKPCFKGHVSDRYTSNGMCVQCTKENNHSINSTFATNRGQRAILAHLQMVPTTIHVPSKYTTISKTLERLMAGPNADQFITWIEMMDTCPLGFIKLAELFDYRDATVNVDLTTIPFKNDETGQGLFEIGGNWYIGDEINEVLRGLRSHVNRVIEPL